MKFIRQHWYKLGLPIGGIAILWIFFGHLNKVQVILLLNFVALTLHQFEEYAWPGGEPWIINEAMMPSGIHPDRYPLNQNNAFFINVPLAWTFYILPVAFPDQVWLGIAPTIFGFGQFGMHGIVTNKKLKTVYNPGLVAVVLGHIPLGIWYLVTVYSKNMITPWDWVFGILYTVLFITIGMKTVGYGILADKDSAYPFTLQEMERWNRRGHLPRIRNAANV